MWVDSFVICVQVCTPLITYYSKLWTEKKKLEIFVIYENTQEFLSIQFSWFDCRIELGIIRLSACGVFLFFFLQWFCHILKFLVPNKIIWQDYQQITHSVCSSYGEQNKNKTSFLLSFFFSVSFTVIRVISLRYFYSF